MRDMAAVAERLRLVRGARHKFLRLHAIEQAMVEPLVDRLAADLAAVGESAADVATPAPLDDPPTPAEKP